jgi:cell wall-associated NlpC family hydrolase
VFPFFISKKMQHGLIHLAIVPLRDAPAHKAQQVSQLLFGESFEVLEIQDQWLQVKTDNDDYTGFIQATQAVLFDAVNHPQNQQKFQLTAQPVTVVRKITDRSLLYLPAGSRIAHLEQNQFAIGTTTFELLHPILADKNSIKNDAYSYLNTPYLWGGRTHFGIDCSGFAQAVYLQQGIQIKRDAWQQAEQGKAVDFLQSALPGDLAFFDNEEGRIVHVGIMLDIEQIIHASGSVKIDRIDDQGIYSAELKKYTHQLRIIKRFL